MRSVHYNVIGYWKFHHFPPPEILRNVEFDTALLVVAELHIHSNISLRIIETPWRFIHDEVRRLAEFYYRNGWNKLDSMDNLPRRRNRVQVWDVPDFTMDIPPTDLGESDGWTLDPSAPMPDRPNSR